MEGIAGIMMRTASERELRRVERKREREAAAARDGLLEELRETSERLCAARSRFENETNFDLIAACVMELDSLEKRYCYLIKRAKHEKISAARPCC